MTPTLGTSLLFLALAAAVAAPAVGQERMPRAGAPTATVTVSGDAPAPRRPRAGATLAAPQAARDAGLVIAGSSAAVAPCGRKYCGVSTTQ